MNFLFSRKIYFEYVSDNKELDIATFCQKFIDENPAPLPFYKTATKVGSMNCQDCKHNKRYNIKKQFIYCNYRRRKRLDVLLECKAELEQCRYENKNLCDSIEEMSYEVTAKKEAMVRNVERMTEMEVEVDKLKVERNRLQAKLREK